MKSPLVLVVEIR